ncbi:type II toxin-antitoxin system VapC family toxin [Amycolatopsis alkalitolerans]|uniref:type II toxin-antitoxin system VapC family toxin n=1 Tax=Amycolatopsis alkalitolerans TaxID=2547244 RepID=UPI001F447341|nr:type II toxin-antitoxin system VapC family toxin [Amycolatopsis alkalitolerans]
MTALYVDTSAVVSAYLADEVDHHELRALLFEGEHIVLTSELTRVEFASAIKAAKRQGRIPDAAEFLAQFDEDTEEGMLNLIPLAPHRIMPRARRVVLGDQPVRTLDAIHLAVAMNDAVSLVGGAPVVLVTRDQRQAEAAKAHGIETR